MFDKFAQRHVGVSNPAELGVMLDTIGVKSVEELISQVIPASIRLKKPIALFTFSILGKINQKFSQCNYIIKLCCHFLILRKCLNYSDS